MKVLILNHHFTQDIEALVHASDESDVIRIVAAEAFASVAREVFPAEVFGSDLARYHAPEYASARARYRERARQIAFELYLTFPFEALVVPSDTFFYIRDVIQVVRELGIPTVTVQKESGVSAKSLEHHSADMRHWFPFCGDAMTVCSQKSKDFWVAAGADPSDVSVLGQPRFDVYHAGGVAADLSAAGVELSPDRPVLLFLSYDLDAYAEERTAGTAHRPWERLHRETEEVLVALAHAGLYTVVVKPHPQQDAAQLAALTERLSSVPHAYILPTSLDTRALLLASDVVVGFQTTAIAEAMIAGKRVVYTFWTATAEREKALLLPFHGMEDAIDVATSPRDLRDRLTAPALPLSDAIRAKRQGYCEPYLGLVDGSASRRVWDCVRSQIAAKYHVDSATAAQLRRASSEHCHRELAKARRRATSWKILAAATGALKTPSNIAERSRARYSAELRRIHECRERLAEAYEHIATLRGARRGPIIWAATRLLRPRL
ncbi:MAG: hypothetical protein ACR2MQ_09755 [Gemmatimonadaceae bacterium]